MKTALILMVMMVIITNTGFTFEAELEAKYKNKPGYGIYKIRIEPLRDINNVPYTLYDGNFNPVAFNNPAYNWREADNIEYNAVYSDAGAMGSNNGSVYYGIYKIQFLEKESDSITTKQVLATAYIDFRDGDYGYPSSTADGYFGVPATNDFFIYYNFSTPPSGDTLAKSEPGGLYFKYGDSISTGNSYGIWELFSYASGTTKLQNVSLFKNFTMDISTYDSINSLPVTINSTIYQMDDNSYLKQAYGFNGTNLTISVPNQARLFRTTLFLSVCLF